MKMKKIYTIALALAALLAAGCTRELPMDRQEGDIRIRIGVDGLETKAAGTAEENVVNSLDVFVYKSDETTVLYHEKVTSPSFAAGGSYYEQTTNLAGLTGSPTEDEVKNAVVYAIANYDEATSISGTESLATLQALEVDAAKFATPSPFVMTARGGFTSGTGNITVASLQLKRLAAKVTLKLNLPATCTTTGTDPTFGETTTTWTPMTKGTNFKSMLQNAVGCTKLDGSAAAAPDVFSYGTQKLTELSAGVYSSADFYSYPVSWTAGSEDEPFVKVILSWSYVTTADSDGSEVDRNVVERYYKIVFSGLSELAANTWYQPEVTLTVLPGEGNEPVLVIPEGLQVQPWGLVGGSHPSASPISDVAVTDTKFIALGASDLTVERGETASFEVLASGPVTMTLNNIYTTRFIKTKDPSSLGEVGTEMTDNYGNKGDRKDYIVQNGSINSYSYTTVDNPPKVENYDYTTWVDESGLNPLQWVKFTPHTTGGGTLKLLHKLSSRLDSDDFAITPYVYEIRLALTADSSVYKDVEITQVPAISMENTLSKGYVYVNNQHNRNFTTGGSENRVYPSTNENVYPSQEIHLGPSGRAPTPYKNLGYLPPADMIGYTGKCKFRFTFKVVPYDEIHAVTDTRAAITGDYAKVFTSTYSRSGSSPYVYVMDNSKTPITHSAANQYKSIATTSAVYYIGATMEKNYVSPEFMVASSYGGTSGPTYFGQALLRCATYQEDGYPAGRWRLPTEAELEFMVRLQDKGIMPVIIANNTWASSGRYFINSSSGFDDISSYDDRMTARCVYDTWYWGSDPVVANTSYTVMVNK